MTALTRALVATDAGPWLSGPAEMAAIESAMPRLLAPFDSIDPVVLAPEGLVTANPIFQELGVEAIVGQELLRQRIQLWRLDRPDALLDLW